MVPFKYPFTLLFGITIGYFFSVFTFLQLPSWKQSSPIESPPVQLPDFASPKGTAAYFIQNQKSSLNAFTIFNKINFLPNDWVIQLFVHGPLWHDLEVQLEQYIDSNKILVTNLYTLQTDHWRPPRNKKELFTSVEFWKAMRTEQVLIFDDTTVLCSGTKHTIDEFLDLDWVGAPWIWAKPDSHYIYGGNGALSLRKRSVMIEILEISDVEGGNEDMFFVRKLVEHGSHILNSKEVGSHFSVEEVFYSHPFGVSHSMRTLQGKDRATILENCPEARVIVGYLGGTSWILDEMKGRSNCDGKEKEPPPPCPHAPEK